MNPAILALDLGTKTGWAIGRPGAIVYGTENFANASRFEGGGMRFLRFRRWLDDLLALHKQGLAEIVFEEVRFHGKGIDAAHLYGGLLGHLTAWAEEYRIPYQGRSIQSIKTFATTFGNARKEQVVAAVEGWGYQPPDHNCADALALLHLRLSEEPADIFA